MLVDTLFGEVRGAEAGGQGRGGLKVARRHVVWRGVWAQAGGLGGSGELGGGRPGRAAGLGGGAETA